MLQSADQIKAAQQEAEAMKRETALVAATLEGRTQTLARQEAAAAESWATLQARTKELDSREVGPQHASACLSLHPALPGSADHI